MTKSKPTQAVINQPVQHGSPCPSCGYCPTCGRKNAAPAYPYWPYTYTVNPWYQYPYTWTISTGAASIGSLPVTYTTTAPNPTI